VLEQFPGFGTVATILAKAVASGNRAEVAPDKTNGRALRALERRKAEALREAAGVKSDLIRST
jgi:hypothetical protein